MQERHSEGHCGEMERDESSQINPIHSLAIDFSHSLLNIDGISGLHMLLMSAWALTISGRN